MSSTSQTRPEGFKSMGIVAKTMGLAVLGMGLVLGGCNNKIKEENEALRMENAEMKERASAAETRATSTAATVESLQRSNSELQAQLAAKAAQPAPMPMADTGYVGGGNNPNPRPARSSSRSSGTTMEISGDVLFASGQATLKPDARKELDKIASRLERQYAGRQIVIEGHTDSDPIKRSKFKSNESLSKARAEAVRDYLVKKGISRSLIDTVGKGASEPKGSKAASRRVDIVVVD